MLNPILIILVRIKAMAWMGIPKHYSPKKNAKKEVKKYRTFKVLITAGINGPADIPVL